MSDKRVINSPFYRHALLSPFYRPFYHPFISILSPSFNIPIHFLRNLNTKSIPVCIRIVNTGVKEFEHKFESTDLKQFEHKINSVLYSYCEYRC